MTTQQPPPAQLKHAIVKQILSGDTVLLRNVTSKDERTLALSSIVAPKLARRPNQNGEGGTKDEPYAWEAREFLRKKLIGKKVFFTVETTTETKREYGTIYINKDSGLENVTESLVAEGLVDVRRSGIKPNEAHQRLCELEDSAKAERKGKFGHFAPNHVRNIVWSVENPRNFVDSLHQEPVKAIVEHVRDGSTMRVMVLPDSIDIIDPIYYSITLMLSGIRCPTFKMNDEKEPFADEAKYFTECRLLQRDVEVILESISNQNFLGTVIHPNGNITELLLAEGFARCIDWSLQCVTSGLEKLRFAEKSAKEKRLRLWKDYSPNEPAIDAKDREFTGKVVEVINADAMLVKRADGFTKKIFLSSIRPPRLPESSSTVEKEKFRPLYEIPYMFEAREFLRKKLIGKKVNVTVDYIQPPGAYQEKTCCTVTIGGINVAEALVSKGLATVVKYRADDDQRSAHYDELLSAETKAKKAMKGLHSKKDVPIHRIVDLSGDLQKSKQFFPFLQRAGRMEAIVEFVSSGSRLRVFVPRENCLITLLLAGINCMKPTRDIKYKIQPGDPFGDEALAFTKDLCMQKEVQIEVDSMDKVGNFIGWLWVDNIHLSELLVKEGYAEVHSTASRSPYYKQLKAAEDEAQKKKLRMWEKEVPVEIEPTKTEDTSERSVKYVKVTVTEVTPDLSFFAQHCDEGPVLEELLQNLREELTSNPPLPGAYKPRSRGENCAARFSADGLWYRARIEKIMPGEYEVIYIDYGNKEVVSLENLAELPTYYQTRLPACAHEYQLAFIKPPKDPEAARDAQAEFIESTDNAVLKLNVEFQTRGLFETCSGLRYVTLHTADETTDIGKELVAKGLVFVEPKKDRKFQNIINEYLSAQESAKKNRLNLWQYGDVTEDDAKEFG